MVVLRAVVRPLLSIVVVAAVGAALVGRMPSSWWAIDLLANLRVHVGLVALGALVVTLIVRSRVLMIGAAVAVVATAPALGRILTETVPDTAEGAPELAVGHINLQGNRLDLRAVIDEMRAHDTDVFVLLVVHSDDLAGLPDTVGELAIERSVDAEPAAVIYDTRRVELVGDLTQPISGTAVGATVRVAGFADPVDLLAIHPPSPTTPDRTETRNERLAQVDGWVATAAPRHVVLGDFNTTPESIAFRRLRADTDLVDSLRGHGWQPSWPVGLGILGLPIDHVLHDPGLVARERVTGRSFGSQHRSLWVTLVPAEVTADARE
jgi:hypothetical protein